MPKTPKKVRTVEVSIKRKGAEEEKVVIPTGVFVGLQSAFAAAGGNIRKGKYTLDEFMEYICSGKETEEFFEACKKFKAWDVLNKSIKKHPTLIYLLLYATFVKEEGRQADLPLILATEADWVYEEVYKKFKRPAYIVNSELYNRYIAGKDFLGRPYTNKKGTCLFVTEDKYLDDLMDEVWKKSTAKAQNEHISKVLGFDENWFEKVNELYKISLKPEILKKSVEEGASLAKQFSQYIPNGSEPGANEYWVAGGKTSGGMPEIVLRDIPNTKEFVKSDIVSYARKADGTFGKPKKVAHKFSENL